MPRTKISEFSATAADNTDIDGINIAEGCAPSVINNAIRELMSQLKDFQTGAGGDSFNGAIGATTPAAGTFTSLSDSGNLTFTGTGNRIRGDFSNATVANRVAFQTSTTDSNSNLYVIPNGTATTSQWVVTNSSDLSATSTGNFTFVQANSTEGRIGASRLTASGAFVPLTFYTSNSERLRIDTSGNVGIGVSNPSSYGILTAYSASNPTLTIASGNANAYLRLNTTSDASMYLTNTGGSMTMNTANTERMRIDSAGNVGIGTSSPGYKLTVDGGSQSQLLVQRSTGTTLTPPSSYATTIDGFLVSVVADNSPFTRFSDLVAGVGGAASVMRFFTGTAGTSCVERMRIASDGIITMSAYGAGAATFSAAGVISSVSDETWKTKDGVPTNPDEMLQKLQPGYWFYNEEKAPIFGTDRQLGFYAQNVNEAIGNEAAPTPEEGKPWGYYDRSVLAVAVMSLKNALSTIEELKERIATLENK